MLAGLAAVENMVLEREVLVCRSLEVVRLVWMEEEMIQSHSIQEAQRVVGEGPDPGYRPRPVQ